MDHLIVAPAIHLGNTLGFVGSLAPDIVRERLVLIDNTVTSKIDRALGKDVQYVYTPGFNTGVAAAWNCGIKHAREVGARFLTICSTSLRFKGQDQGRALCRTADIAVQNDQWPWGFESLNGWRCITLGCQTWEEVGYFDEGFYPAYFEDNDYIWRMRCAGILEQQGAKTKSLRLIPWIGALEAGVVIDAHAIRNCDIKVDFVELEKRYCRKWGGKPGFEQWDKAYDGAKQ